jgi:hypothetical protein
VRSPINNWIPGFKYDIVALAMKHAKNPEEDNNTWFVLEVYDITRCVIDAREFKVDASKIIRNKYGYFSFKLRFKTFQFFRQSG